VKYVYLILRLIGANIIAGLVIVGMTAATGIPSSLLVIAVVSGVVSQLELKRFWDSEKRQSQPAQASR
jgi:hypothetical protein